VEVCSQSRKQGKSNRLLREQWKHQCPRPRERWTLAAFFPRKLLFGLFRFLGNAVGFTTISILQGQALH